MSPTEGIDRGGGGRDGLELHARLCQVLEAADGDEAWAMISRYKPSVVLLDVQMPGRTGLEVLAMIRGDPSLSTTRVIMLTAGALKADVEVGLAAGADLYLTMPFSPLDL